MGGELTDEPRKMSREFDKIFTEAARGRGGGG